MGNEKLAKGSIVKNWIIGILIGLLLVLLYSNTLSADSKNRFYWIVALIVIVIGIIYLLSKDKKFDVFDIGKVIVRREYSNTGIQLNINRLEVDHLDAENLVISFPFAEEIFTYKWDRINNYLIGRLPNRKLDKVIEDTNSREVQRSMALNSIDKKVAKKLAEDSGFELRENNNGSGGDSID